MQLQLHHKNAITVAVDSYSLCKLKFVALLRLQRLWHYQASRSSWVFLSYVSLLVFMLENILLDCNLKSRMQESKCFLHHASSTYKEMVVREAYWYFIQVTDVPYRSVALLPFTFLIQNGLITLLGEKGYLTAILAPNCHFWDLSQNLVKKFQQKCQKCQPTTRGRCKISTKGGRAQAPFNENAELQYSVLLSVVYICTQAGFSLWHHYNVLEVKSVIQMNVSVQLKISWKIKEAMLESTKPGEVRRIDTCVAIELVDDRHFSHHLTALWTLSEIPAKGIGSIFTCLCLL